MGEYKIEECSTYAGSREIGGIPVYIFEKHNMALPAWGVVCNRIKKPAHLVTFDSHTDTHWGFNSYICEKTGKAPDYPKYGLKNPHIMDLLTNTHFQIGDFSFEDVWSISVSDLKNTEQILCGVDFGYLLSYVVVNREDGVGSGYEKDDRRAGYQATYISRESWDEWNVELMPEPLIVDFDLDFFGSPNDFDDKFKNKVAPLLKKTMAITIAKEAKYFECCKTQENYTVEAALTQLLDFIEEALES